MSKVDFQWDMTEADWKRMLTDLSSKKISAEEKTYGAVRFGNCRSLFVINGDSSGEQHLYSRTYVLTGRQGSTHGEPGHPSYQSVLDFSIPDMQTFDKFKTICERGIALHVGQYGLHDDATSETLDRQNWE